MSDTGFDCGLCFSLAINAVICQKCGQIYCKKCLAEIFGTNLECLRCESKQFGMVEKSALQEIYQETISKSQIVPPPPIIDIKPKKPEIKQVLVQYTNDPCKNFELCKQNIACAFVLDKVCGPECYMYTMLEPLIQEKNYEKIRKQIIVLEQSIIQKKVGAPIPGPKETLGLTNFKFDRCAPGIIINSQQVSLQEEEYTFKTVTCSKGFTSGIHYWKINPLQMTKNEMKIGVAISDKYDLKTAFSDYNFGYAYYTVGQFRNGSNSNGFEYGIKFKNSGEVGVLLDMNRGILAFSYNGTYFGKVVQNDQLKKGTVYPCVALLHQAGFEYVCGIPIPADILKEFLK